MKTAWTSILSWVDNSRYESESDATDRRIDWVRCIPFFLLHAGCLGVLWVGWSPVAVGVAIGLYIVRMFAITAFYHRYFSHRSFQASRLVQFLMAVLGNSAAQRGPLWWAAHHRYHHRHSDEEDDLHSPSHHGFLWSHMLWFTTRSSFGTDVKRVPDLASFPELRWLDRFDWVVPTVLAAGLFATGAILDRSVPGLGTSGMQMLVWGFFISTLAVFHGTCLINSAAHLLGSRRFSTRDNSRNSLLLALVTFGEGWHNNHHHYPASTRQGFYWWEVDFTYYLLRFLEQLGVVRALKPVPVRVLEQGRRVPPAR